MPPLFALVDCNNFYVSCECVFQPRLCGHAVVVLSNNDGCVIARSEEAKAVEIPVGLPAFQLKERFPNVPLTILSSHYVLYGDMSARVMQTLRLLAPAVEIYSIDEAFLDLAGCPTRELLAYGSTIRQTVQQWTGIPVSISMGPTKTLAKIANRLAKQIPKAQGVVALTTVAMQEEALATFPVKDIWGIGRNSGRFLNQHDIHTAQQLRDAPEHWIRQHLGVVGLRLVWELRGLSCLPLVECPPPQQSCTVSRSFGRPITTLEEMREAIATYLSRAAEKLRCGRLAANALHVFLMTNRFVDEPQYSQTITLPLPVATNDTAELFLYALQGMIQIFRTGYRYKKAGVLLTGLVPASQPQRALFDRRDRLRAARLMQAVDALNAQMGANTVRYAVTGIKPTWSMRAARRSPCFTTRWEDLSVVQARGDHTAHNEEVFLWSSFLPRCSARKPCRGFLKPS